LSALASAGWPEKYGAKFLAPAPQPRNTAFEMLNIGDGFFFLATLMAVLSGLRRGLEAG